MSSYVGIVKCTRKVLTVLVFYTLGFEVVGLLQLFRQLVPQLEIISKRGRTTKPNVSKITKRLCYKKQRNGFC